MDKTRVMVVWLGLAALVLMSCTSERDGETPEAKFADDPEAHALYDKMLETLMNAESIYYESDYTWECQGYPFHAGYSIWMKKPNYVRIEAVGRDVEEEGILVGDGEYFWIYWPKGRPFFAGSDSTEHEKTKFKSYMRKYAPQGQHSIAHDIELLVTDLTMTIIEPSVFHGYKDPMEPYLDGVRSMGTETVGEEECYLIEASFMDHQRSRYIWLSKRDYLPRRLRQLVRTEQEVVMHELWTNVTVNEDMPLELFTWKSPDEWVEFRPVEIEEGLLKPGTEAPDFDLHLIDRTPFRLSDHRGSIVWLVFWRVGCQPCRLEIPHLQGLYTEYKDRNVIVLGFDYADKQDIVQDFLSSNSVSFPNIVDSSPEGQRVFFDEYQKMAGRSEVPLNYIIGRDGRVVDAWYGFDDNGERGRQLIASLTAG